MHTHAQMQTHALEHMHAHIHTHAHTCAYIQRHTCTHTYARVYMDMCTHAHTPLTYMQAYLRAHMCMHTHTHVHTLCTYTHSSHKLFGSAEGSRGSKIPRCLWTGVSVLGNTGASLGSLQECPGSPVCAVCRRFSPRSHPGPSGCLFGGLTPHKPVSL